MGADGRRVRATRVRANSATRRAAEKTKGCRVMKFFKELETGFQAAEDEVEAELEFRV